MLRILSTILIASIVATACGEGATSEERVLSIYTSVTQDTVDAVVAGFEEANPDMTVEVFRAPTGELTARIAAELRNNALQADVLWLTDPLSMQQYSRDGLLLEWQPDDVDVVPAEFRTETFFGTRILNLVIVAGDSSSSPPEDWDDLATIDGEVAVPDPGFAGSAFAALAFFALEPDYGMSFYEELAANGAVQVRSPGDVVTGVAEGLYAAGITLDRTAKAAVDDGSPIMIVWPASGAIALYSPIGVVDNDGTSAARRFVEHVLSKEAQVAIASTGWEPIREDVEWVEGNGQQTLDWRLAFDRQEELLDEYADIFRG